MCDIISEIAQANGLAMEDLLNAVLKRYAELFPDWDVGTVSIQKSQDKNEQLDRMIELLQKMKTLN
mgnify:CR=1 FL=1